MRVPQFALSIALSVVLAGCTTVSGIPSNILLTDTARPGMSKIVLGLDPSMGSQAVSITRSPDTRCEGPLMAELETNARATAYFAFEVPPGTYAHTGIYPVELCVPPLSFAVPANSTLFIGTFALDRPPGDHSPATTMIIRRDDTALAAANAEVPGIQLAAVDSSDVSVNFCYW